MATYNWQLWDNFTAAAEELGFELSSKDGGCVYIDVPEDIRQKFYVMCWTPLNKLQGVMKEYKEDSILGRWDIRLKDLRQNHGDFHLEFGAKSCEDGSMYWFPNFGIGNTPSKDDIVKAVRQMLDTENFDKYVTLALLREPAEEYEAAE
jgi:hypothetical protein